MYEEELLLFDIVEDKPSSVNDLSKKYSIRHKFIEKIIKIVNNKLFVDFYIEYFDNYKTSSPQIVLFITDLKKFLEKNKKSIFYNLCDISLFQFQGNRQTILSSVLSRNMNTSMNITNITIGEILNIFQFSNIQYTSNFVINKLRDLFECRYMSNCLNVYRESKMFGDKELVCLCMRIDFSNPDVYNFGVNVISL